MWELVVKLVSGSKDVVYLTSLKRGLINAYHGDFSFFDIGYFHINGPILNRCIKLIDERIAYLQKPDIGSVLQELKANPDLLHEFVGLLKGLL